MRILFAIRPYYGHLHPMVPLASALASRGHLIRFATAACFCRVVRDAGFDASPAGLYPGDPLPEPHEGRPYGRDYGAYPVQDKCAALIELGRSFRPDAIIRDPTDVAAVVAAEELGLPCVTMGFCDFIPSASWDILLGGTLDEVRGHWGLDPDPCWERMHPSGYLNMVPEPFRRWRDPIPGERPLRPDCRQSREPPPPAAWLHALPLRPAVYVTLGTAFNFHVELMLDLLHWLAALPVSLVCTVGPDVDIRDFNSVAQRHNVYLRDYVPLELILPRCDAVVTAGGFNTVMAALQFGLPMLVMPLGADQPVNAERVAALGAGFSMDPADAHREAVTEAVKDLLAKPSYRVHAARLEERIQRMPEPQTVAAQLEDLIRRGDH